MNNKFLFFVIGLIISMSGFYAKELWKHANENNGEGLLLAWGLNIAFAVIGFMRLKSLNRSRWWIITMLRPEFQLIWCFIMLFLNKKEQRVSEEVL